MAVPFRYVALLVLVGLSVAGLGGMGCSTISEEKPPLPDSTFTRVLVDLHMTRARGKRFTRRPPGATDSVFAHHGVHAEAFDATLRYYTRRPDAFSSLYEAVVDSLNALRSRPWTRSPSPSGETAQDRTDQR
jgi:hypothetical protein